VSRFCLACFCFDHVQLRYNVALKFDATFNVIVFPPDVGERFARLITLAPKKVPHWGLDRASIGDFWVSKSGGQEAARRQCRKTA
jgi:hypothetical protein